MIDWPDSLIEDLARRRVLILLGSGVSRHSKDKDGNAPPTWRGFLDVGLSKCEANSSHIRAALKNGRYLDACEWIKKRLDEKWQDILHECYLKPKYKPARIHELIFQLDARIVLTPNFDRIYDTYATSESQDTVFVKKHTDSDAIDTIRRGHRVIIKAHGSIEEVGNVIFSASDYALARTKYANFYDLLKALTLTNPVLMIGVGLDDPDFQLLFEDHASKFQSKIPHYMLTADKITEDAEQTLRTTRNIKLLRYKPKDNHFELVLALEELVKKIEEKRDELSLNRDW